MGQPRSSPLEMAGVFASPWKTPEAAGWLEHSPFRGIYTLCAVLATVQLGKMFYNNYGLYGNFIQGAHKLYLHFSTGPELLFCLGVEYVFCHLAFVLQLLYSSGKLGSTRTAVPVHLCCQGLLKVCLLSWGCLITWHRPSWPFFSKLALMFQTIIFAFKVHSYCSTNRQLSLVPPTKKAKQSKKAKKGKSESATEAAVSDLNLAQLQEAVEYAHRLKLMEAIYPANVTLRNFSEFLWMPTLCYEMVYPRTESI